ncbi:cell division ATP-binding protein FtsE [Algimonas porphyrae]|uniref:Cell division ATP-binding protein FtsE n=1 Tax=Algimonas porphyrae TaxID=1128113 RepID=A0ABQ5UZ78_9PROT|nr:cell division ATP-binding protein FtsE [Algimonas porphyrae]GLQ19739.1 cell division ATP-binding protein FtsE [Algimonas porphyrae]
MTLAPPHPEPSLVLERVGLRYGRGPEVLSDIDLSLPRGSFTFLTGPSGAGKSSLLKLCYLELKPSRGLIRLFGEDVDALKSSKVQALRRRIGVVLQDFRLIDHLSVFENVALPLRVAGESRNSYASDVIELLNWVGLGHRMGALPPTLSGGEKQRCAIARAVIAKPDLLIADEPTGNVDPEIGARLLRLFSEMNRMGATVLIATHDVGLIDHVSARTLRLDAGRLNAAQVSPPTRPGRAA